MSMVYVETPALAKFFSWIEGPLRGGRKRGERFRREGKTREGNGGRDWRIHPL